MALWNEPSRREPISKDSPGLTAAVLSFMVVLATGGNTATAQGVSGPADGGSTGIVVTTFASGFTMTTATGIEVTVNETSSTKTVDGPGGDVRKGTSVLVLGLDNSGATITADWVVIQPHGDGGAAAAKAHGVIPFESGVPSPAQSVGTILVIALLVVPAAGGRRANSFRNLMIDHIMRAPSESPSWRPPCPRDPKTRWCAERGPRGVRGGVHRARHIAGVVRAREC